MASVEKRLRDGKVTWQARWRDPDGRQRKRTFAKRSDAERFMTGVQHSVHAGSYVDLARSRVTVGEWAERWLAGQVQLKPSTRARYEILLRRQVLPTWERVPLAKVGHADVAAWVASLAATGLAAATVRQAHRVLSLVLTLAVRDGRIPRNPADGVPLPRARRGERRFLTHGQVVALAAAAGPYRLAVLTLAYCGLRYGELAALRVSRVDLMRRRLDVAESVTEIGGRPSYGTPKTHQQRSVPVPRSLVDDLAVHVAGKAPSDLLFTSPDGGLLRLTNFRRRCFDRAAREVGLDGLTPHELRHTAASLAVSAGANVKGVQRLLGHASAAMTLDVYAGLFDDDLDAVAERLDAAVSSALVPRVCPGAPVVTLAEQRAAG
ncbi:MAG: site-specific integrase [Nocardioidaceae bacterium]|nr:site-specific integrase [Nocardioidaceae bacterium]